VSAIALTLVSLALGEVSAQGLASVRVEARARNASPSSTGDRGTVAAADLEVSPTFEGRLSTPSSSLVATLTPSAWLREPYGNFRFNGYARAGLRGDTAFESGLRLFLSASAGYGVLDLGVLRSTAPAGPGPVVLPTLPLENLPALGAFRDVNVDARAGFDAPLSGRTRLAGLGGFFWGGGADDASRISSPLQRAPYGELRLEHLLTQVDAFLGVLEGRHADFGDNRFLVSSLSFGWRRQILAATNLELSGGLAVTTNFPSGGASPMAAFAPRVLLRVAHAVRTRPEQLTISATVSLAPFFDRFLATVYERAEGAIVMEALLLERWNVAARGGVGRGFGAIDAQNTTATFVEGSVGYLGARWWRADLIARTSVISVPRQEAAAQVQWNVGLAMTFRYEGAP
jgi:hypothetical protein